MANTISDLNEYLFAALDAITNSDLHGDELEEELKRSKGVVNVAGAILHAGELALEAVKELNECGYENIAVPKLLGGEH